MPVFYQPKEAVLHEDFYFWCLRRQTLVGVRPTFKPWLTLKRILPWKKTITPTSGAGESLRRASLRQSCSVRLLPNVNQPEECLALHTSLSRHTSGIMICVCLCVRMATVVPYCALINTRQTAQRSALSAQCVYSQTSVGSRSLTGSSEFLYLVNKLNIYWLSLIGY